MPPDSTKYIRIYRKGKFYRPVVTIVLLSTLFGFTSLLKKLQRSSGTDINQQVKGWNRKLLQVEDETPAVDQPPLNCTPRSIDEFPGVFLTDPPSGVIVHFIISFYVCLALAIVCDDYFVSSLEHICNALKIKPDVAGATFMAAGSSAPEFFTALIGVFLAQSDVGTGTIVGSAVFNLLGIASLVGLGAGMVVELSWYPIARDCGSYLISVLCLILVIYDGDIQWYEGLIMLALYVLYILLMYYNERLEAYAYSKIRPNQFSEKLGLPVCQEDSDEETGLIVERERVPSVGKSPEQESEEVQHIFTVPDSFPRRVYWLLMLPFSLLLVATVPDCRRAGVWRRLYMLTFTMSIVWIAALSYVLVWMIAIIGDTLAIPDTIMGLTILAVGTSVPDALSALFVSRDGLGDMAIASAVGSNVFDVLMCLGLPWFVGPLAFGTTINVHSGGLTYTTISLFATVLFLIAALLLNKWRLNRKLGVICLFVYAIFLTLGSLFELNVFGYINPPPCPRADL